MNGELTERERAILDMWPRFEDGEPVWIGDKAINNKNQRFTVKRIEFRHGKWMLNDSVTEGHYLNGKSGERVERPAPKVLDADGVEIHLGDTVYELDGQSGIVIAVHPSTRCVDMRQGHHVSCCMDTSRLTHTRPDSWERLEEDADKNPFDYCKDVGHRLDTCENSEAYKARDIIRRAKKLAGVE